MKRSIQVGLGFIVKVERVVSFRLIYMEEEKNICTE